MVASVLLVMDANDWSIEDKPYDLRECLFNLACTVTRVSQFLHTRGPIGVALSAQLLKSGTSAGANYEADDGSSPRPQNDTKSALSATAKFEWWELPLTFGSDN